LQRNAEDGDMEAQQVEKIMRKIQIKRFVKNQKKIEKQKMILIWKK
jgi:hypothetical protein